MSYPHPPMPLFRFWRLHIPTGERGLGDVPAYTRLGALEIVNRWNGQMPGLWQYWLD